MTPSAKGSGSSSSPTSRPGRSRACCSPTWAPTWSRWSRRPATRCGRGRRSPRTRQTGERFSHNFASVNRNKRVVVADLKDAEDLGAGPRRCVAAADVVVENYRPGVLDRLGLGYDEVRDGHPGLVYCSISGYGLTSPYVNDGAYDVVIQGMSGADVGDRRAPDGGPVKAGVPVGDFTAGLYAAYTVAALLPQVGRDRPVGTGRRARCSTACSPSRPCRPASTGGPAASPAGWAPPTRATRRTRASRRADGDFTVAAGNDRLWAAVAEVTGLPRAGRRPAVRDAARPGRAPGRAGGAAAGAVRGGEARALAHRAAGPRRALRTGQHASARSSPTRTSRRPGWSHGCRVPVAGEVPHGGLPGADRGSADRGSTAARRCSVRTRTCTPSG